MCKLQSLHMMRSGRRLQGLFVCICLLAGLSGLFYEWAQRENENFDFDPVSASIIAQRVAEAFANVSTTRPEQRWIPGVCTCTEFCKPRSPNIDCDAVMHTPVLPLRLSYESKNRAVVLAGDNRNAYYAFYLPITCLLWRRLGWQVGEHSRKTED